MNLDFMKVLRVLVAIFFAFFLIPIIWDYEVHQGYLLFYATVEDHLALIKEKRTNPMTNAEVFEEIMSYQSDCLNEGFLHRIFGKGVQFDGLTLILIVVTFIIFK